jgi:hypothetical protein
LIWLIAGASSSFLMTKFSYPIGRIVPKIEIGVFSWRMLTITSLVVALLAGVCWQVALDLIGRRRRAATIICSSVSILVLIATVALSGWYIVMPMYRAEAFRPIPEHYNYATLPRGATREAPKMELAQLSSGAGRITIERWQPELRRLRVELARPDQLQFRTSNFPGWTAFVNGRAGEIKEGRTGNIVLDLPAGEHQIDLDFRSTPIRRVGNWITIVSFALLILILAMFGSRRSEIFSMTTP